MDLDGFTAARILKGSDPALMGRQNIFGHGAKERQDGEPHTVPSVTYSFKNTYLRIPTWRKFKFS
jgi:hypothetical protein